MIAPVVTARRIGTLGEPIAIIDDFHPDPDALRRHAMAARFGPARDYYPGVRADLPADYFAKGGPLIGTVLARVFAETGQRRLIDASFSIVTSPPAALTLAQRLPHVDAIEPGRIALVHYLALDGGGGTAFFRHRATGIERLDAALVAGFYERLNAELQAHDVPEGYVQGSTALFEQIAAVEARYNRAVIYRSALFHSGSIPPNATLDSDPATGRLTVTAFIDARRPEGGPQDIA